MKRRSSIQVLMVGLVSLLCTSCGLIEMEFDPATNQVLSITFTYDTVYAMERDTFFLAPYMYPDSLSSTSIAWGSEDSYVVKCLNDTILAQGQGWTRVHATTFANNRSDTCTVCIMPRWEVDVHQYPYDMVVYAHILIDGKVPGKNWIFGTFDEDDMPRGIAVPMNEERTIYRFRIWSELESTGEHIVDSVYFYAYNKTSLQKYKFEYTSVFTGLNDGTPSKPIELSLSIPLPPVRKQNDESNF